MGANQSGFYRRPGLHFIALAILSGHPAADCALPNLRLEHGVIAGTGAAKFFAGDNMPDVYHYKTNGKKAENHRKKRKKLHSSDFERKNNSY
jgi:hypothetical protein